LCIVLNLINPVGDLVNLLHAPLVSADHIAFPSLVVSGVSFNGIDPSVFLLFDDPYMTDSLKVGIIDAKYIGFAHRCQIAPSAPYGLTCRKPTWAPGIGPGGVNGFLLIYPLGKGSAPWVSLT
tara:strand:- start:842 stop:1210 length:369 start_codon:yes stop_codon:yes gene_type:complete